MNYTQKIKNIKDIDKLSTKRLLSYYKARRKDRISFISSYTCDCCGESAWDLYEKDYTKEKKIIETMENHLKEVKELLSKREHVRR
jgi:hypothetical protein